MVIKIALSKQGTKHRGKYEAIVDDCDSDLAELNWRVEIHPHTEYTARMLHKNGKYLKSEFLHRVILERILGRSLSKNEDVDHIDNNGLNNKRSNLRIATRSQNMQNSRLRKDNTSGYKCVVKRTNGRYSARIYVNKKYMWLGTFDTPELAHRAYCEAAIEHFGEFANFGDES